MIDEYLTIFSPTITIIQASNSIRLYSISIRRWRSSVLASRERNSIPLADKWFLSKAEVAELKAATDAYNAKLKQLQQLKN
jgi:hypothetical protein